MKTYAYVKSETCISRDACLPGSFVGKSNVPVSRHGDWNPWYYGKLETLAIVARGCADASRYYQYKCACLVADLLDWRDQ